MATDGGDQGEDGLRGLRAAGPEGGGRDERGDQGGGEPEAAQAHRDRVRGPVQGTPPAPVPDREGSRVLALHTVRTRGPPLRSGGLRQEGSSGVRQERDAGPSLARPG